MRPPISIRLYGLGGEVVENQTRSSGPGAANKASGTAALRQTVTNDSAGRIKHANELAAQLVLSRHTAAG